MDGWMTDEDWAHAFDELGYPEELRQSTKLIAYCESRWIPTARNGQYRGLMQISPLWFDYSGENLSAWADPLTNLRVALATIRYDLARGYDAFQQWECRA